jgi:hypothetical protein
MKTTNFQHATVLVLGVLSACSLPPDLLEVGDEDSSGESESTDTGESTDTAESTDTDESTDTGGPEPAPELGECVLQGSDLQGEPEPDNEFQLPDCEVVCTEGWGHDVPWLESEWTRKPPPDGGEPSTRGALAITPDDRAAAVLSGPDAPLRTFRFEADGSQFSGSYSVDPIDGEVLGFGIDLDDIHYYLWTDGAIQRLVALQGNGHDDLVFEIELGPHHEYASTLDAVDDGVIVALDDGITRLLRFDQTGGLVFQQVIPPTTKIDISPSGDVLALANPATLSWADTQGNFLGSQPIDGVMSLLGLVAIDDMNVVFVGGETDPSPDGGTRAFLRAFGEMGPGWSHSYDRAELWCDAHATEERFTGVDQLADGTLVVVGDESLGDPYGDDIETWSQPWIAHVSADGEVLAVDRGLWLGRAIDVVARDNFAYVLLTEDLEDWAFGLPHIRKYAF